MAMLTVLQAVPAGDLDALRRDPRSINAVDTEPSYFTHFGPSINYFLTGDAYPADHPLAGMLDGTESVASDTMETGAFGIVAPDEVAGIAGRLAALDLARVRAGIEAADIDELIGAEELEDLEVLGRDEIADTLLDDITRLAGYYAQVATTGRGVVMYTS